MLNSFCPYKIPSRGGNCWGWRGHVSQYSEREEDMFMPPKNSLKSLWFDEHTTQWPNQFPFGSTAKIAPRMRQNSPFWAEKPKKKFMGTRPLPQWGRIHRLPTPYAPRRLRRLDARTYGARHSSPNLQQKSPPLIPSHTMVNSCDDSQTERNIALDNPVAN